MVENNNMIDDEQEKLVLARLKTMSEHIQVNMGDVGPLDKEQLIAEVKKHSLLGKRIIDMEMDYLRSLKDL